MNKRKGNVCQLKVCLLSCGTDNSRGGVQASALGVLNNSAVSARAKQAVGSTPYCVIVNTMSYDSFCLVSCVWHQKEQSATQLWRLLNFSCVLLVPINTTPFCCWLCCWESLLLVFIVLLFFFFRINLCKNSNRRRKRKWGREKGDIRCKKKKPHHHISIKVMSWRFTCRPVSFQLQTPLIDLIVLVAAPVVSLRCVCNLKKKKKTRMHKNKQKIEMRGRQALTNESFYLKTNTVFLTHLLLIHKSIKIEKGCVWKCSLLRFRLVSFAISATPKLRL